MAEEARNACVIGYPVAHSRSPLIHNFWLKQHGLSGEYRREEVKSADLPAFIAELAARGYAGTIVPARWVLQTRCGSRGVDRAPPTLMWRDSLPTLTRLLPGGAGSCGRRP
jgi:hypothetical protein